MASILLKVTHHINDISSVFNNQLITLTSNSLWYQQPMYPTEDTNPVIQTLPNLLT